MSRPGGATTVVMPASTSSPTHSSGIREAYPSLPPPPITCTCPSTRPGTTRRPAASISTTSRPPVSSFSCDRHDPLAGDQDVADADLLGIEEMGVSDDDELAHCDLPGRHLTWPDGPLRWECNQITSLVATGSHVGAAHGRQRQVDIAAAPGRWHRDGRGRDRPGPGQPHRRRRTAALRRPRRPTDRAARRRAAARLREPAQPRDQRADLPRHRRRRRGAGPPGRRGRQHRLQPAAAARRPRRRRAVRRRAAGGLPARDARAAAVGHHQRPRHAARGAPLDPRRSRPSSGCARSSRRTCSRRRAAASTAPADRGTSTSTRTPPSRPRSPSRTSTTRGRAGGSGSASARTPPTPARRACCAGSPTWPASATRS